ncbi:HAD family acid phosphatase [Bowmanella denitrificans]|uniref:HAD family acid phosphatase n=1 Tax=Bowmanella denitrificans TaxID=366582 RepID=UPI001559195E|nr:HAD family acid phosphatase [Bowmanella denitrificans]
MNIAKFFALMAISSLCSGCVASPPSPATVSPADAFTTAQSPQPKALKVATWNTEHLAYPGEGGCKPRSNAQLSAMRRYTASLDADVIALQEVDSKQALRLIFPDLHWRLILSDRPDSQPYQCRENGDLSTQQKLAFAIRREVPLLSITHIKDFGLDLPGLRYGLAIRVDAPTGPIDILNLHLKSGCFVDDYLQSDTQACRVLAKQADVLNDWIAQREKPATPYLVLGDFNHRISAPYNRLSRVLLNDERSTKITTRNLLSCHPRHSALIDHILAGGMPTERITESAQIHTYADEGAMLSDHCAVSVSLSADSPTLSTALLWQITSKEYQLLSRAIYQQAQQALAKVPADLQNWVVVMDVDETVLDNTAYQKQTEIAGTGYSPATWDTWVQSEQASLVPGVKPFIEAIFQRGGKLALVTNRNRRLDIHTWRNLQALGIPITTANTCLIGRHASDQDALDHKLIRNDKDLRRQQIVQGDAPCFGHPHESKTSWSEPHNIVLQVGDNIEDFSGLTQQQADIGTVLPQLGKTLFLLPNPLYGSWQ